MALNFEHATRVIVLYAFLSVSIYLVYQAIKNSNSALLLFFSLILFFNIPYWIANTIIFNQFLYFLTQDVSSPLGISSASLIIIDPLINALFGISLLICQRKQKIDPYMNLYLSSILMAIAFLILSIGLFLAKEQNKLNFLFPLATLVLFACSEFLLQTTLNSRIRDLLIGQKSGEFIATGIMRSSRAFAKCTPTGKIVNASHINTSAS